MPLFLCPGCLSLLGQTPKYNLSIWPSLAIQQKWLLDGTRKMEQYTSQVRFGAVLGNFSNAAVGKANVWKDGYGNNHFVVVTGLKPSSKYYFICGDSNGGWSKELSFTTPPETPIPFTVGVYGDMGIDNSANTVQRVVEDVKANKLDWIYHVGDIAYADDHVLSFQGTWNEWSGMVEPISSVLGYMVLPGNHEYTSYNPLLYFSTRNFVVYNHRFLMPGLRSGSNTSMFYSFDYGNVHFVSYSTETSFPDAPFGDASDFGDEVKWLERDLQAANLPANRKLRPWIIVGGHRPIYSSCKGYSQNGVPINSLVPPSNSATLQTTFEDLFTKYKVDIILTGHVHSYERNYPAYKNKRTGGFVNPPNPIGIVIGNAGNMEGLENGDPDNWDIPQPEWSAFRFGGDFGYAHLSVHNDTHINWKFFCCIFWRYN